MQTIAEGRSGIMPAFQERLDDTQVRLLVAWIMR
jgi:mono/diheme cytochrome c family protein